MVPAKRSRKLPAFTEQCARTGPCDPQTVIPSRSVLSLPLRKRPIRQIAASPGHQCERPPVAVLPDTLDPEVTFKRVLQTRSRGVRVTGSAAPAGATTTAKLGCIDAEEPDPLSIASKCVAVRDGASGDKAPL